MDYKKFKDIIESVGDLEKIPIRDYVREVNLLKIKLGTPSSHPRGALERDKFQNQFFKQQRRKKGK